MNGASPKTPPARISSHSSGRKMRFESTRAPSSPSVRSGLPARSIGRDAEGLHPALEVAELVLRLAGQEVDQAALHALAREQRVVDLLRDRHLDAVPFRQRKRRIDGVRAL